MTRKRPKAANELDLFLDSGAFSAWTQKKEIGIEEYIQFIKENESRFTVYANMDVIALGKSTKDRAEAARRTLENQKTMERAGLAPLPVFHMGEPLEYLDFYVKNYPYIAMGGLVGAPRSSLITWLDHCFRNFICGANGLPKIKVHGFGITAHALLLLFPWYSVDSTSWVMVSRMGGILVPSYKKGNWVYDDMGLKVTVSSRSPKINQEAQHISTLSPRQRDCVLNYLHEKGYKLGSSRFERVSPTRVLESNERWAEKKQKDPQALRLMEIIEEEGVSNKYQLRDEVNIIYYQDLEKALPEWPWEYKSSNIGFNL